MPEAGTPDGPRAVTDTGPLIHLAEIDAGRSLAVFSEVLLPGPVMEELRVRPDGPGTGLAGQPPVQDVDLHRDEKDLAEALSLRFDIGTTDGSVLAMAHTRSVPLILTDDLDVRDAAEALRIRPVGSVGILLRAATVGTMDTGAIDKALTALHETSSLFITRDLVDRAREALREHGGRDA